jgi:hypothetical protein
LEELSQTIDSLQIDNKNYGDILAECREIKQVLNPIVEGYKNELSGERSYRLKTPKYEIADWDI